MQRNPDIPFTYEYSQPEEYHFSIDSIEMPWEIALSLKARMEEGELSKKDLEQFQVLDLCAGCGVIGFELNYHLPEIKNIDFVEVQDVYGPHFEHNKNLALAHAEKKSRPRLSLVSSNSSAGVSGGAPQFQFLNVNYESLLGETHGGKYDLILCNPPYFAADQGKLSPSEFKNRCRFYLDSSFEKLVSVLCHTLRPGGEAYLLLRSLEDHGIDQLTDLRRYISGKLQCESFADIRGTMLLKLYRA